MRSFPKRAQFYILTVTAIGAILLGLGVPRLDLARWPEVLALSVLGGLALIFNALGTTENTHYNICLMVFSFTLFQLGAPELAVVITLAHLIEWPVNKWSWFIQTFNIGQYIITGYTAGLIFRLLNPAAEFTSTGGVAALFAALLTFVLLNALLVGLVIYLTRGIGFKKSGVFNFLPLMIDFTLVCMGAAGFILWGTHPLLVVLLLVSLYILYSVLRVPALERESMMDAKTGVFNARYLVKNLEEELARANRYQRPLTIVMADLDLLRNINNTYGHLAGDVVLKGVADILRTNVREYDIVARFGGEEFAIMFPEMSPEDAYPPIDRIRKLIEEAGFEVATSPRPIKVTLSFGIAGRTGDATSARDLIHNADIALYAAKQEGRNRARLYSSVLANLIGMDPNYRAEERMVDLDDRVRTYVYEPPREDLETQQPTK
jgi:diguanylate cyclase (GGDEF)-like protein